MYRVARAFAFCSRTRADTTAKHVAHLMTFSFPLGPRRCLRPDSVGVPASEHRRGAVAMLCNPQADQHPTNWERTFVEGVQRFPRLSEKQKTMLESITGAGKDRQGCRVLRRIWYAGTEPLQGRGAGY